MKSTWNTSKAIDEWKWHNLDKRCEVVYIYIYIAIINIYVKLKAHALLYQLYMPTVVENKVSEMWNNMKLYNWWINR